MPPAGFEPTISEGERPQTYALDRAAAGTGPSVVITGIKSVNVSFVKDMQFLLRVGGNL